MINELSVKNFYENRKMAYVKLRQSERWDESYKWDILPALNKKLHAYETITSDNATEIIALLQKANPNAGSFCHWIDFDNLQELVKEKPVAAKALSYIWRPKRADAIGSEIDSVNNIIKGLFNGSFHLSPAAFGYFLAAQDVENFTIYSEKLIQKVADVNMIDKPKTQGEKYQLLNDTCHHIGSLMAEEKDMYGGQEFYTALNGQDFLYVTEIY